jgi:hypothetical protein
MGILFEAVPVPLKHMHGIGIFITAALGSCSLVRLRDGGCLLLEESVGF